MTTALGLLCACPLAVVCEAGAQSRCSCEDGRAGEQVCAGDGQRWLPCVCEGAERDAGALGADASPVDAAPVDATAGDARSADRSGLDAGSIDTASPDHRVADAGSVDGSSIEDAGRVDWRSVGLSGGGGFQVPGISPHGGQTLLVTSDMGGVYLSHDGGQSFAMLDWWQLSATITCPPLFDASDASTIYAVDDSFYRSIVKVSHDAGRTWTPLVDPQPWGDSIQVHALASDPRDAHFLLVGLEAGVYLSDDGGQSWWSATGLSGVVLGFHVDQGVPVSARRCFAATSEGIYRSDDGCHAFVAKNQGLDLSHPERSDGVPNIEFSRRAFRYLSFAGASNASETVLYVAVPSWLDGGTLRGGLFRSRDAGESWQRIMGTGINVATDYGDAWGTGPIAQYAWVLASNAQPRRVYVTNTSTGYNPPNHMTVFRSDDAGESWQAVFYSDPRFADFNVEHDYTSIVDNDNDQDPARGLALNPADPDMLIFTNDAQVFVSRDAGGSWQALHTHRAPGQGALAADQRWLNTGLTDTTTWHYDVDPFDPQRRYISYTDIGFARSTDGGASWIHAARGLAWRSNLYALAFDPAVPGKMWGAFASDHDRPMRRSHLRPGGNTGGSGVALSLDHGATWQDSSTGLPGQGPITALVVDPSSPQAARVLYAAVFGAGVYKSVNAGASWSAINQGLGYGAGTLNVYDLKLHADGSLFCNIAGLDQGGFKPAREGGAAIYRSVDGGASWQCLSPDTPARWIPDFDVDPGNSDVVYFAARHAGADNQGVYKTSDGGQSWSKIAEHGPEHFAVRSHPTRPGWVYVTLAEDNPSWALWLSKDAGATWRALQGMPFQKPLRVEFVASEPGVIYVTSFGGGVWRGPAD